MSGQLAKFQEKELFLNSLSQTYSEFLNARGGVGVRSKVTTLFPYFDFIFCLSQLFYTFSNFISSGKRRGRGGDGTSAILSICLCSLSMKKKWIV